MTHVLRARRLLTEEGWLDDHQLRIADGVICSNRTDSSGRD